VCGLCILSIIIHVANSHPSVSLHPCPAAGVARLVAHPAKFVYPCSLYVRRRVGIQARVCTGRMGRGGSRPFRCTGRCAPLRRSTTAVRRHTRERVLPLAVLDSFLITTAKANFTGPKHVNLVVAKASQLEVYTLVPSTSAVLSSRPLQRVGVYALFGNVQSMRSLALISYRHLCAAI
jgi:hypothetical protein